MASGFNPVLSPTLVSLLSGTEPANLDLGRTACVTLLLYEKYERWIGLFIVVLLFFSSAGRERSWHVPRGARADYFAKAMLTKVP